MFVFTVASAFLVSSIFSHMENQVRSGDPAVSPMQNLQAMPPMPLLQAAPKADMKVMLEQEHALLTSYGWASKPEGRVRIPVDRAVELVAQRGLPARSSGGNP